jgi:YVTN family beta-propeller protein
MNLYAADAPRHYSRAVAGIRPRVYVPNTLDGTVDVIDPRTHRVTKQLRVGGQPHHITPSWDLRHLYVDNPGNDTLAVIDPKTVRITRRIKVASPYNLYFTPDGKKALVVSEYNRLIEFRNPHTWRLIKQVRIPWPGVDHMDFSADGRFLLVSCEYSGILVRINTEQMRVTGTLAVGGRPIDVKASPNGRLFYVANQGLSGVTMVDPARLRKVGFIHTGVGAHGFAVSRDGRDLYVSNRIAGSISVISFAGREVIATWHVGGSPDMLQVSPSGRQLWASNRFGNTVSVISTVTGRVTHTIPVGRQPHGLAYFPQPGRFSLGHNGVYR